MRTVPTIDEPTDFTAAQRALKEAEAAAKATAGDVDKASAALAGAEAALTELDTQIADVDRETGAFSDAAVAAAAVARIDEAEAAATLAQGRERAARAAAKAAAQRVNDLVAHEADARRSFDRARHRRGPGPAGGRAGRPGC